MRIGTHNSGSYRINWNIGFWKWNSKWEWLRIIAKWIPPLRRLLEGYITTQTLDILQQLNAGIDIIDLRVSYANDTYYVSHTFCCTHYTDIIAQIYAYIYVNRPTYPITILLSADKNNNTMIQREESLLNLTLMLFKTNIIDKKVQIYYKPINIDLSRFTYHNLIMNYDSINKHWLNTKELSEFIKRYKLIDYTDNTGIDCVLTPQVPTSIVEWGELLTNSIEKYAKKINPVMLNLLNNQQMERPSYCLFDYVTPDLVAQYLLHDCTPNNTQL